MMFNFDAVDPAFCSYFDSALAKCDFPFPEPFTVNFKTRDGRGGSANRVNHEVEIGTELPSFIERNIIHETAHQVVYQTFTPFHERVISNLLHAWKRCPHTWGEGEGFNEWALQPDETFCELFLHAFTPLKPYPMKHGITKNKARQLRALYLSSKAPWLA